MSNSATCSVKKILVGVDLSQGDWLASDPSVTSSHFACDQSIEVAKATGAKLHYLATLNLDERTKRLLEESNPQEDNVISMAREAMVGIVQSAASAGVQATYDVVLGRTRSELVEAAREGKHDLMMLGTRHHGVVASLLLGSTTLDLLRTSPCPLWVVKPCDSSTPRRILVATDFSDLCHALVDRAAELAGLFGAELHIVHVFPTQKHHFLQFSSIAAEAIEAQNEQCRADGRAKLEGLLKRPTVASLAVAPQLHLLDGTPSQAIQERVTALDIDLLVMGTVRHAGVSQMVVGTTAQNILPSLSCSLLSMRPEHLNK